MVLVPMVFFAPSAGAEPGPRSTESERFVVVNRADVITVASRSKRTKKRRKSHRTLSARKKSTREVASADKWWLNASPDGPVQVVVSMEDQEATVYVGDKVVARSRVSTGKKGHRTPTGVFSILQKNRHHRSNLYNDAPMPYMQRLTWSGIALHSSKSVPNYPASHGCVRLPNEFARKLFKFTDKGAHVVIAKSNRRLSGITHPALFQPIRDPARVSTRSEPTIERDATPAIRMTFADNGKVFAQYPSLDGPEGHNPLAGMVVKATVPALETITVASLRLSTNDADDPVIKPAAPKSTAPIRMLVTRRTGRELIKDVQTLLNQLSYDAGDADGYMGPDTGAAIKRFQQEQGLTESGSMSGNLLAQLYEAAGKGEPLLGHLYVRQNFKDILDAPIRIDNPEKALGTHFFTAQKFDPQTGDAPWTVMSLDDKPRTSKLSFLGQLETDARAMKARTALDRLTIPDNIRTRISALLTPGSSLAISDNGISRETGRGTDFVVLTR